MKHWTTIWIGILILMMGLTPIVGKFLPSFQSEEPEKDLPIAQQTQTTPTNFISTISPKKTNSTQTTAKPQSSSKPDQILLFDEGTGKEIKVDWLEYAIMATACEMPALYEVEAIKAQAIATVTYARYLSQLNKDPNLPLLSVNSKEYRGYSTKEHLKALWGEKFEEYFSKISKAVKEVENLVVTYDGKPILASYFAISTGWTEGSENVWGRALPYLKPVEIVQDRQVKGYEEKVSFSKEQVKEILTRERKGITLPDDPASWFGNANFSKSETVLTQQIGDQQLTGQEIRKLFDLRSASFVVNYENETFDFVTHGYGHCVGFSQTGANELAKQGLNYEQILCYFYTDTVLQNFSS